ncbi:rod shape-determining protein RodA [soil metagenome]
MKPVQRILGPDATLATWAWLCILAALALSLVGVYAIDVASQMQAPTTPTEISGRAAKQGLFVAIGLIAALIIAVPDHRTLRLLTWPALAGVMALLVFVLLPFIPASIVTPRNGVRGWINLGSFDLQPSELAKIVFILCTAAYLRVRENHRTLLGLLPPALISAAPLLLIFLEPDLGQALLFVPALFAMLLAAGAKVKHLLLVCLLATLAAPAAWQMLKPYQRERILDAYSGFAGGTPRHATSTSDQPQLARMLAGSGGVWGYGDGQARAVVRYSRLPERHNDMIFAVVVARFGLVGGLLVLGAYGLWLIGAVLTAAFVREGFGRLLCVGAASFVFCQVAVNVGMVVGVVPVIGVTLPFVSYGGSSMIVMWVMTGLILGVGVRRPARFSERAFQFED